MNKELCYAHFFKQAHHGTGLFFHTMIEEFYELYFPNMHLGTLINIFEEIWL